MSDSPPGDHGEGGQDSRAVHADHAQGMQVGDHARQSNRFTDVTAGRDALVAERDIHLHVHVGDSGDADTVTRSLAGLPALKGTARVVIGEIPRRSVAFQERPEILRKLMHPAPDAGTPAVFAVTGLRGAGKSQLAAACARHRVDDGWRMVAWLDAEDGEQLLGGFARLAAALGLTEGAGDSAGSAVFGDRDTGAYLVRFSWTAIERHVPVKGAASPDDPALASYWADRRKKVKPPLDRYNLRLLSRQDGTCPLCGDYLLSADQPPQSPEQRERWWLQVTRKAIAASYLTHHGRPGPADGDQTRLVHASCQRALRARQRKKPALQPATPSRLA